MTIKRSFDTIEGVILEDRGVRGDPLRHVYFVEATFDEWNTERLEYPEERLTLKEPAKAIH